MPSRVKHTDGDAAAWLPADWPAPASIHAGTTTRAGGVSAAPFDTFNLASHVGDEAGNVGANHLRLRHLLKLPAEPCWLDQQHGTRIIDPSRDEDYCADGSYSAQSGVVCAVLSADCVPVLLTNRTGSEIAAVHAGWRGICGGVIQQAIAKFRSPADELLAWLGPHIRQESYRVRDDMRQSCLDAIADADQAFSPAGPGRWFADLATLACAVLRTAGVNDIHQCGLCTYQTPRQFYSYRREPTTGRMATLIWTDA